MDKTKTVTATFKKMPSYLLTVTKAGTGTGVVNSDLAGINCGDDCTESYLNNTVVSLNATADAGNTFTGWSGVCSGTATCKVTMTNIKKVTATFRKTPSYLLTVTKAGNGTGLVSSDLAGINCGDDCTELYAEKTIVIAKAQ
jgi:hypothetical protein